MMSDEPESSRTSSRSGDPSDSRSENRAHFGRKKGHKLRAAQAERFQSLLPKLALDLNTPPPNLPRAQALDALFSRPVEAIWLEIGFGGAEHLLHQARLHPEIGFLGCEAFEDGVAKALAGIDEHGLDNIRLHHGDAIDVLHWLGESSIDRLYLLYPDPWPKRRHWKRRFISPERLADIARILKPGAEFRFASDISSNITWTLSHVARNPHLRWRGTCAADWRQPWGDWISTRYEQKAIRERRTPAYFVFERQ